MKHPDAASPDEIPAPPDTGEGQPEDDLWFLPGPPEEAPDLLPGPRPEAREDDHPAQWAAAQAGQARRLAEVAARLGALDDRLRRGPEGWRHRLAILEAAELSWLSGARIPPDRLALWVALRVSSVQDDGRALAQAGWAVRRLTGGPGPEAGLPEFLGRHDPDAPEQAEPLSERAGGWHALMRSATALHPITRAGMGYQLWALAGLTDRLEAAVTAARVATGAGGAGQGAVFAPLAMGGAGALRASGSPPERLARWLDGMEGAILTAMRELDRIETWEARAIEAMKPLSGRTPPALRKVLADWPLVSAPMAETLTGASRAAVQRNLAWMETRGLIREITGQGRFRMWRAST